MEEKQLDLNRPFRSVRRIRRLPISPPAVSECDDSRKIENSLPRLPALPAYKSEMKSGPIRNPGTVPFLWEQSPGRPKDESKSQTRPPVAPKLPPGRVLNIRQKSSDKGFEGTAVIQSQAGGAPSSSPNAPSFNENVMKRDSSKQESGDKESSDSENDSEAYADARDTLSMTESSLLNCSVSGLSGLDGPYLKPFGAFSDPQTRDFMMGRFLPAAKAMTSELPHYNTRKQPVARELPPRQVNKIVSVDKRQSLHQHKSTNAQHCARGREAEESEDDSDNEPEYASAKVCGLLPQFCLLSPISGLRVQGHAPISSAPRAQAKPLEKPDGSFLYKHLQVSSMSSQSPIHEEKGDNGIPLRSRKNLREMLACKSTEWEVESASPVAEKTLYIDSVHVAKPPDSNSSCSDTKEITDYIKNDFETLRKEMDKEETCSDHSVLKIVKTDDFRPDQDLVHDHRTSTSSKMAEDMRTDPRKLQPTLPNNHDTSRGSSYLPLPLPLPKSPSESWLSRALTTASARNHHSSPGIHSFNRTHASKTPPLDPKWETIVKSSNAHHERLRFSEELLAPIPEA